MENNYRDGPAGHKEMCGRSVSNFIRLRILTCFATVKRY